MWSFFCVFHDLSLSLSSPHNTQTHVTGVCGGATTAATASPAALSDTSAAAASAVAERRRSAQAEAATGVEGEGAGGRRGEGEEAAVGKRAGKRGRWWGRGGSPRARPRSTTTTREGAGPVSLSRNAAACVTASCRLQLNTSSSHASTRQVGACRRARRARAAPRPDANGGARSARAHWGRSLVRHRCFFWLSRTHTSTHQSTASSTAAHAPGWRGRELAASAWW